MPKPALVNDLRTAYLGAVHSTNFASDCPEEVQAALATVFAWLGEHPQVQNLADAIEGVLEYDDEAASMTAVTLCARELVTGRDSSDVDYDAPEALIRALVQIPMMERYDSDALMHMPRSR